VRGDTISHFRLLVALAFLALSLLVLIPAPTRVLWELSVAVGERGYLLAPLAILLAFIARRPTRASVAASLGGLFAGAILLIPVSQGNAIAASIGTDIDRAFGAASTAAQLTAVQREGFSIAEFFHFSPEQAPRTTLQFPLTDSLGRPAGTATLPLDFYPARKRTPAPLVVMIHGGSWQSGARTDLAEINTALADHGYSVAAVSYRFAPNHPFPAALDDVRAAIRFLLANSVRLGIDTARIVIAGRSAGGQLALLAAYTARDPAIRGVIGLYSPADLIWGYEHPSNPRVLNSTQALEDYIGGSPTAAAARYHAASPFDLAGTTTVPTLLIHGANDELVSVVQSERLDRRLALHNAPHLLIELPWATHGCDYFINGPCGQIVSRAVLRFLGVVTR